MSKVRIMGIISIVLVILLAVGGVINIVRGDYFIAGIMLIIVAAVVFMAIRTLTSNRKGGSSSTKSAPNKKPVKTKSASKKR